MEATRIIAIRHGETTWNADGRVQGHTDIGLSDTGRAQAQRLAQALAGRDRLDAIYSSDLARARDTAVLVSRENGMPISLSKGANGIAPASIVAYYAFVNRIADGLGVELESAE